MNILFGCWSPIHKKSQHRILHRACPSERCIPVISSFQIAAWEAERLIGSPQPKLPSVIEPEHKYRQASLLPAAVQQTPPAHYLSPRTIWDSTWLPALTIKHILYDSQVPLKKKWGQRNKRLKTYETVLSKFNSSERGRQSDPKPGPQLLTLSVRENIQAKKKSFVWNMGLYKSIGQHFF